MKRTGAEVGVADSAKASSKASISSWSIGGRRLESSASEVQKKIFRNDLLAAPYFALNINITELC